jgi:hypothetical protein
MAEWQSELAARVVRRLCFSPRLSTSERPRHDASIPIARRSASLPLPPIRLPCGGLSPSSPPPIPEIPLLHHQLNHHALARHLQPRPLHQPAAYRLRHLLLQPDASTPPLTQRRRCRLSRLLSPRLPRIPSRSRVPPRQPHPYPPPKPSSPTPTAASAPTLLPATPPRATLRPQSPNTSPRARLPTDSWMRMQRPRWLVCRIQMVAAGSRALPT